jgi:hypothetical protein
MGRGRAMAESRRGTYNDDEDDIDDRTTATTTTRRGRERGRG